ncbi:acyltransferase family protein [Amnibacterium kyonggiense]|uniref:Peptidoglycan/LPS O-acetylase OafA/YrhL n=1 Tax=Amnibacterium kyonggiense TaxID=595671 RepID=A0A4R7FP55_9MICO|nr:acyltransferase family protein [Amnibacterium kyonggiense]TDS79502.1 peptidoglycan/LPS O-acetylase OafA/YrhL [Amnibacterium kyonggiense]
MSVGTLERNAASPRFAQAASPRGSRLEIQALRAIAVGMVVMYHLRPTALPGGYVGVDVFFVISGFLISRHLVKEASATGGLRLGRFWAGRVRRILPAALVATVAVVAFSTAVLPRTAAAEIGITGMWAALSAANWRFAASSTDYLAQSPDASPFEHFWSLGVEEQFYLVWPLAVLGAAMLARRRLASIRTAVLVPFVLVLIASLLFGIVFTFSGSPAAYFVTPTRMWELAAGGVLAVLLVDRQPPPLAAAALQIAGVIAILLAGALFTARTPMPGVAALVPVAGALAVITAVDAVGLRRIWAIPPVQYLGAISYSLYLWHWPVIVFTRLLLRHPLGIVSGGAVIALSLLLATLSYRLVEQPLRRVPIRRPGRLIAIGIACSLVVAAVAAVPILRNSIADAAEGTARTAVLREAGPAIGWPQLTPQADRTWARSEHVVVPGPDALADDLAFGTCTIEPLSTTSPICVAGDTSSRTTIAVVGDSHVRQWASTISRLGKERHWRVLTILHNSCPFNLLPRPLEIDHQSRCTEAVRWTVPVLEREHVSLVVTSAYRKSYRGSDASEAAQGYADMWRSLQSSGIQVVALGDTPTPMTDPIDRDCIVQRDPARCGLSRERATAVVDPLRLAAARTRGVTFVDPTDAFCGTTWCPGVIGNVGVYVDDNHASNTYLSSAYPWVQAHLGTAISAELRS